MASVIGEIFTKEQIRGCSERLSGKEGGEEVMGELEKRGLVELVEEGGGDGVYRFEGVFMRETLF